MQNEHDYMYYPCLPLFGMLFLPWNEAYENILGVIDYSA